jgi:class 3 adenylate cyclase
MSSTHDIHEETAMPGGHVQLPDGRAVLPRHAERRVTSILFADLAGFTSFAEQLDPEEVRDFLPGYFDHCREIIARYGGTVEKFIGDAVMAVWGVPSAHEDDAERAVRAGLELVEQIPLYGQSLGASGIELRVGIATGEVAVTLGAIGQGMVSGDAVNTASRLQARAMPGEVWVEEQTEALSGGVIVYADKGEHLLKGKSSPVHLFAADGVTGARGQAPAVDHLTVPLFGYRREFALIKELYYAALEESQGRMLLVAGEPGVGKTRLARELENYLDGVSQTVLWHWGTCHAYGDGIVFSALVDVVRSRIRATDGDLSDTLRDRIEATLNEYGVETAERRWMTSRLAVLLGLSQELYSREDLYSAWLAWFETLGGSGEPIVWVIDDAHYADDALLDFVEHLVRSISVPLFVMVTARPELLDRRPRFGSGKRTSFLNLEGLNVQVMGDLVDALVSELPQEQRQFIVEQSGGIPLYAIETVRSMLDRGEVEIVTGGGRVLNSHDARQQVSSPPASLQVLVSSRLDLLDPLDRALLQDAAVIGETFGREDLLNLCGLDEETLDKALGRLHHRDLIGTETNRFSPHAGQFTFVQSIVRQVAYDLLSRRDRADRHVRVAEQLMASESSSDRAAIVAQHLTAAISLLPRNDSLARELADQRQAWLEQAGERAASVGAHRQAMRLFDIALEDLTNQEAIDRISLRAAEAADRAGDGEAVSRYAENVSDNDHVMSATASALKARVLGWDGRMQESVQELARYSTAESLQSLPPALAARICTVWISVMNLETEANDMLEWAERALIFAEESEDPMSIVSALRQFSLVYSLRGLPRVDEALITSAIGLAREHHLTTELGHCLSNRGSSTLKSSLERSIADSREGATLARQSGWIRLQLIAEGNLCVALRLAGRWDECLEIVTNRVLPDEDWSTAVWLEIGGANVSTALIEHARGQSPTFAIELEALPENDDAEGIVPVWIHLLKGVVAWVRGDTTLAASAGAKSVEVALAMSGLDEDMAHVWPLAVEWALADGKFDDARRVLAVADSVPLGRLSPLLRAQLLRMRGTLNALDPGSTASLEAIESDLRGGIDALGVAGVVPDRARAQAMLGTWLLQRGRNDEATPLLEAARDTYVSLGSQGWLDELSEAIAETGASLSFG